MSYVIEILFNTHCRWNVRQTRINMFDIFSLRRFTKLRKLLETSVLWADMTTLPREWRRNCFLISYSRRSNSQNLNVLADLFRQGFKMNRTWTIRELAQKNDKISCRLLFSLNALGTETRRMGARRIDREKRNFSGPRLAPSQSSLINPRHSFCGYKEIDRLGSSSTYTLFSWFSPFRLVHFSVAFKQFEICFVPQRCEAYNVTLRSVRVKTVWFLSSKLWKVIGSLAIGRNQWSRIYCCMMHRKC